MGYDQMDFNRDSVYFDGTFFGFKVGVIVGIIIGVGLCGVIMMVKTNGHENGKNIRTGEVQKAARCID